MEQNGTKFGTKYGCKSATFIEVINFGTNGTKLFILLIFKLLKCSKICSNNVPNVPLFRGFCHFFNFVPFFSKSSEMRVFVNRQKTQCNF